MAGFTPYDQLSFAQFTPMSAQEVLMPAQMMRERHDQIDAEYAALNENAAKAAFIAAQEEVNGNIELANQYNNYVSAIGKERDALLEKGVTGTSRRNMFNLRSRFQSEIQPMITGYELRNQDIMRYNDMKAKDPSYMGVSPSSRSVSDYIKGGLTPMEIQGYSANMLKQEVSDIAKNFKGIISQNSDYWKPILDTKLGPMAYQNIVEQGLRPGTAEYDAVSEVITEQVLGSKDLSWATPEQLDRFTNSALQGMYSAIGEDRLQQVNNKMFDFNQAMAIEKWRYDRAVETQRLRNEGRNGALDPSYNSELMRALTPNISEGEALVNPLINEQKANAQTYKKNRSNTGINALGSSGSYSEYVKANPDYIRKDSNNTSDMNKTDFNFTKAAYDFVDKYKDVSYSERKKALEQILPNESESMIDDLAIRGPIGFGIAAKLALNTGVEWSAIANVAKGAGVIALPLIAAGGLTSGGSTVEIDNRDAFLETIQHIENPTAKQYQFVESELKKNGITPTDEMIYELIDEDLAKRTTIGNNAYNYESNVVRTAYENEAKRSLSNIRGRSGEIRELDSNGKIKQYSTKNTVKEVPEDVADKLLNPEVWNFVGIIPHNSRVGNKSTFQYSATLKGKTYYLDLPDANLNTDFETSKAIYSTIENGVKEPTSVKVGGKNYTVTPTLGPTGIEYNVYDPDLGNVFSAEEFLNRDRLNAGLRYYKEGATRTEIN